MEEVVHYGIISLLPVVSVIILAVITKRTFEPLLFGSFFGFLLLKGKGFFPAWMDAVYEVLMDGTTVWIILVCGLFGSLIMLLEKSGGAFGFSDMAKKLTKKRGASLITTWILGIVIFVDDYLNALAVGSAMRKVTDSHRVPRELLAYVINSTGAAVCVLIPFSTWAAFMAGQLEANGVTVNGSATAAFIRIIPYIFYGWAAVLVVPFFACKILPLFGPMRKAVKRAETTGEVFPDSTKNKKEEYDSLETSFKGKPKVLNFLIPMVALAVITVITQDMLLGVIISIVICAVLFLPQKLMSFNEFFDNILGGFKDMLLVLWIIVAAFFLQKANEGLGLTPFVIEAVEPILSANLLPVASFIIIGFLAFATGSFWGVAAIAFPIIIPLAGAMDVNIYLVCGAIVSAAALGSHTCFYGDAVTLSCASSQIQNSDYAKTSLPIIAVPFAIAIILYLVFGFIG
ncbi:MAG: hypothetical protein JEZ04_13490 [Spirochaetales bacterium]|nr:hypothetical protein [Spirochaetales bacterium]